MNILTPNEDPYSTWQKAKDELAAQGYDTPLKVMEEDRAKGLEDKHYQPKHLIIQEGYKFLEKDSYLSPSNGEMVPKYLVGLQANDGSKYFLEFYFNAPYQDAVIEFLRRVESKNRQQAFAL